MRRALIIIWPLVFLACNAEHDSGSNYADIDVQSLKTVDYQLVNRFVFQQFCLDCHAGKERPNLTNFDEVFRQRAAIRYTVFEATKSTEVMPPIVSGILPENIKKLLQIWLDLGAKEEPVLIVPEKPIDDPNVPEIVTWAEVTEKVFDKSCNRCHSADNKWDISDYTNIEKVRSVMTSIINSTTRNIMPPRNDPPDPLPDGWLDDESSSAEPNLNQLSREQKVLLYQWLVDGMPE